MRINLTPSQIETALPLIDKGLDQYLWLQAHLHRSDVTSNEEYRKRFNHFYRVRRNPQWQRAFYELMERSKGKLVEFSEILSTMHAATGRYEASFSSKLLATVNPDMPVIDSIVLRNLGLRLPPAYAQHRRHRIEQLHADMVSQFKVFLAAEAGQMLVTRFRQEYPHARITETKIVDLVLWQTRSSKSE